LGFFKKRKCTDSAGQQGGKHTHTRAQRERDRSLVNCGVLNTFPSFPKGSPGLGKWFNSV